MNQKIGSIGLVTFCNSNYGSVLQCYSTQQILKKMGFDCILLERKEKGIGYLFYGVINRIQRYAMFVRYPAYSSRFKSLLKTAHRQRDVSLSTVSLNAINDFIEQEIKSKAYTYLQLLKTARYDSYVAFISGSDQIWNGDWFLTNKVYFLRFAPKKKRIALAPSFGTAKVAKYNLNIYRKYIKEYAYLSSREKNGKEIIKELTGIDAEMVLDPTALLSSYEWKIMLDNKKNFIDINLNYILLYFLDPPSDIAIETIEKMRRLTGWSIACFGYQYEEFEKVKEISFIIGGPWDFLKLINNASFILTDSFHGTILALNFNIPFYTFKRLYTHDSDQTDRIVSILDLCCVSERLIIEKCSYIDKWVMDFGQVNKILERERRKSLLYIEKSIAGVLGI